MTDWRKLLTDEHLWDYRCKAVPVPLVREIVEEVETLRQDLAAARAERDLWRKRALGVAPPPRFANVSCSQCGREFGPGDHGYSHCKDHSAAALAGQRREGE